MKTRTEHDTFGPIEVPAERLWGAQTERSLLHFRISDEKMPRELVRALTLVKKATAQVNADLEQLSDEKARAIMAAADEVLAGLHDAHSRWVVTHDLAQWKDEIAWMALYFSVAVWTSLALCGIVMIKDKLPYYRMRPAVSSFQRARLPLADHSVVG